jgi:hypothetical protein
LTKKPRVSAQLLGKKLKSLPIPRKTHKISNLHLLQLNLLRRLDDTRDHPGKLHLLYKFQTALLPSPEKRAQQSLKNKYRTNEALK